MRAFLPPFTGVLPGHARHHGHAGDCVCDCDGAHVCGCGDPEKRKVKQVANKTKCFKLRLFPVAECLTYQRKQRQHHFYYLVKPNQVLTQ